MIVAAAARAPDGFAVHGHHLTRDPTGPGLHPAGEAHLERVRVDQHEHPPEGVVGGDAVRQSQEGRQPGLLAAPIERDVLPALGAGDHRTDCDHQDVDELMIAPGCLARILQPRKARCQALDQAARPRLHPTVNCQHIRQSTARPKLMLMLMREPWVHRRAEPAMVWPRKAETGACQMASALLSVARRPSPSLFYLQR